jgi:hypothetical protein
MLSVIYAECHKYALYTDCRYAECCFVECRYTECCYAECRCGDCRGAIEATYLFELKKLQNKHLRYRISRSQSCKTFFGLNLLPVLCKLDHLINNIFH